MNLEDLTIEDIKEMEDENVLVCFDVLVKQEEVKAKRQALLKYIDIRDASENPRTIKIESKVIN